MIKVIYSFALLCIYSVNQASENPLASQLPDLSKSSLLASSNFPDIDQGVWGDLQRLYDFRIVSTFEEHCAQVQNYNNLKELYHQEKDKLTAQQNIITEIESQTPTPLSKKYKTIAALKKITVGIITPIGIMFASKVLPNQIELRTIKAGIQTSGILSGFYLVRKGIKQLAEPDYETIQNLKSEFQKQEKKVTTLVCYLNESTKIIQKHTTFHQPQNTPYGSGEFTGLTSSITDYTTLPE
ncbi:MAG: hypothetical protein ACOYT8_04715 [Candidatus Dependentiae bacterium]